MQTTFHLFCFLLDRLSNSMPKRNKRIRQSQKAIRKRWKQAESSDDDIELSSDADEFESRFSTFWNEGEEIRMDSDEITEQLQALQPNAFEQLVENAKKSRVWATNPRGPIYKGDAQSTLRNKRAYWRKAASGSKKITDMFPDINLESCNLTFDGESNTKSCDLTFDDSSDYDDN